MKAYDQGFLVKCAEHDLPYDVAISLLKIAQAPDPLDQGSSEDPFAGSEAAAPPPPPPPAFTPSQDQLNMQGAWDRMSPNQQANNLRLIGITQDQFNGMSDKEKFDAFGKMRQAATARKAQQKTQPPAAMAATTRGPKPTDMVSYKGSMIPRADYDRIMANKSKELTPQQIAQNRANAVGRGWQIQHQNQQARYSQTGARQPRDANGNLRTINLAGRPTGPYSSRQGVRGIPRPAGT